MRLGFRWARHSFDLVAMVLDATIYAKAANEFVRKALKRRYMRK